MSDGLSAYDFLSYVSSSYDGERNPEAFGKYFFECLEKWKPQIANAIAGTILDTRHNYNADVMIAFLYKVWDHDFNGGE